ncbi:basic helix-loop-helix protein [Tulasnella sp. 403]|nr:basic helix-loop-helix protein [Tulasnella sp. 403]
MLNDTEGQNTTEGNGTTTSANPARPQSPTPPPSSSPGPDQPPKPTASAPVPPALPPPDASYAHESAHHYQAAMVALAHHQHQQQLQQAGLPHLPLPYPPPHLPPMHPDQALPPHLQHAMYGAPPPQVNAGTRPEKRTIRRKSKTAREDDAEGGAEADDKDDEEGSDDGDDSDEYVPEGDGEGGDGSGRRVRKTRRSRGNDDEDDEYEDAVSSAHHPAGLPHPHPHPHGIPPLPPDPHYQLTASQTLSTLVGSQQQSQSGTDGSFVMPIDPHTGLPFAPPPGANAAAPTSNAAAIAAANSRGKRGRRHQNDEEWNRQRKDNHKEVERRRRGNINEGINQLASIVPNSAGGEKAKGAILSRAVQYIHQLKDNEARNIEKWTLEKLLMDQAMGDMQAQLEEYKRRWEVEAQARMTAERELESLKSRVAAPNSSTSDNAEVGQKRPRVD